MTHTYINDLAATSPILRNHYWNPVDTVVRNRVILAIVLSRIMQTAFGMSRAISKLRRRRNTRVSIVQCIVVASCHGEINVTPASWWWQAIGQNNKENKGTRKKSRETAAEQLPLWCSLRSHPRISMLILRIS